MLLPLVIASLCTLQFVCLVFWMIYAVDRELVYPKVLDKFIPVWLNHVMVCIHCIR